MKERALKVDFALFLEESKKLRASYSSLQKKVRENDQNLAPIISQLNEGLIFVSKEGIITLINPAAEKILEVKKVLSKPFVECFRDDLFGFSMSQAIDNQSLNKKSFLHLSNGKEITVSASYVASRGVVCVLGEREILEKSVERNDRLKELGQMAATLAHEIRNPLGGIEGFASLLCRDLKEDSKEREMAKNILEGTKALNSLVTNILNYSRPSELKLVECDLGDLTAEVLDHFSHDKMSKKCHFKKKSVPCICDRNLLKMALLNLLRNGCETDTKEIEVTIDAEEKWATLSVSDFGSGLDSETLSHLFTPFFSTKVAGFGVGLAESHKHVVGMGGTLEVTSEPHVKTTFTIKLRRACGD